MPVAKVATHNRKITSIILTILVLSTGIISAALLIILNRPQTPAKRAASTLSCPAESAYCEWEGGEEGVEYGYEIIDMTTGKTLKQGPAKPGRLTFTPEPGHTYRCTVNASRGACRESSSVEKTFPIQTIEQPSPSPTGVVATPTTVPGCLTPCDASKPSCPDGLTCHFTGGSLGTVCVKNTQCDPAKDTCWCDETQKSCPENKKVVSGVQVFCPTCACTGVRCSADTECKSFGADFVCHKQECVRDSAQQYCESI